MSKRNRRKPHPHYCIFHAYAKKWETGESNFNNIFYLTQYSQELTASWNRCEAATDTLPFAALSLSFPTGDPWEHLYPECRPGQLSGTVSAGFAVLENRTSGHIKTPCVIFSTNSTFTSSFKRPNSKPGQVMQICNPSY